MKEEVKNESPTSDSKLTLFRFELNRSQASLFLISSVMGIFIVSFLLAGDIFLNLFQFIFSVVPGYLENPGVYHEDYLFYHLIPIITRIIVSIIFLSLSIYGFRRILRNKSSENGPKRRTISQKRTVNWLGLKISHGQSLFIFSASLAGLLFVLQLFLEYYSHPLPMFGLLESICWIPEGPNQATSHELLLNNVPIAILAIFFILCLYSLFITRRGKPKNPSIKITKNYALLIFIGSVIVFIIFSARIFCHLALFNRDVSNLLGIISYNAPNSYQNNDFIRTVVFFSVSLVLMISSFFLKERNHKDMKTFDEFSWFHIKLTPHRVTILLSSALICVIFFTQYFLSYIFMFGDLFSFPSFLNNLFVIILIPIIFFCYYPIAKILVNHRFEKAIENINNSREFKTNWFKFRLDKINSVILLSVSSALVVFYLFQLVLMNMGAQAFYSNLDPLGSYMLFSFPFMTIFIFLIIAVNIYTIIKTLPSIRDSKSQKLKKVDDGNRRNE